jgi:hypothetical protein
VTAPASAAAARIDVLIDVVMAALLMDGMEDVGMASGHRRSSPGQCVAPVIVPAPCVVSLRHFHAWEGEPACVVRVVLRRVMTLRLVMPTVWRDRMSISIAHIQPIVALIAGVLILVMPRLLNIIVALYLILVGILGLGILR